MKDENQICNYIGKTKTSYMSLSYLSTCTYHSFFTNMVQFFNLSKTIAMEIMKTLATTKYIQLESTNINKSSLASTTILCHKLYTLAWLSSSGFSHPSHVKSYTYVERKSTVGLQIYYHVLGFESSNHDYSTLTSSYASILQCSIKNTRIL